MILDDQYITKDMFIKDSYKGNASAIDSAMCLFAQRQSTFCFPFCKSNITALLLA